MSRVIGLKSLTYLVLVRQPVLREQQNLNTKHRLDLLSVCRGYRVPFRLTSVAKRHPIKHVDAVRRTAIGFQGVLGSSMRKRAGLLDVYDAANKVMALGLSLVTMPLGGGDCPEFPM